MNDLTGELPIDLLEAIDRVVAAMPHGPGWNRRDHGRRCDGA
ncbi:MAG: hypothetical protein ABIP57_01235 [Jatrophihabitantaceae bacterium]